LSAKQCPLCKSLHWLYACFVNCQVIKLREAKRLKICLNYLRSHIDRECIFGDYQRCKQRHNTMLHFDNSKNPNVKASNTEKKETAQKNRRSFVTNISITTSHYVTIIQALSTAIILIHEKTVIIKKIERLIPHLNLILWREIYVNDCNWLLDHLINGIGQTNFVYHRTITTIRSKYNDYQTDSL